jgi:phospholipid/cholesterol/gamma-HCH transport system substrate-binding protein
MRGVLDRKFVFGLTFIAVIVLVIVGTIAAYKGVFKSTESLTVVSDRAGLTLGNGSPVKLYGVQVGSVKSATVRGDHVDVKLAIDSDQLRKIPAGVVAQIVPPTAFGAKYVQLSVPKAGAGSTPIRAGAVIASDHVSTEINTAFDNLTKVLNAARPSEVNNALTALATAVNGRGERIGTLITQVDHYLAGFNPSLEQLNRDLRAGRDTLDTYDKAMPSILATADHLTVTSDTLVREQATLHGFLNQLDSFSGKADKLLGSTRKQLRSALALLDPVARTVAKYSPELPCVVEGLASANKLAEKAVGGTHPGVTTITRIQPARPPYKYPQNAPVIGDNRGPGCYGLPYVTQAEAEQAAPSFITGANPYAGPQPTATDNLANTFFGTLAGVLNLAGVGK